MTQFLDDRITDMEKLYYHALELAIQTKRLKHLRVSELDYEEEEY